MDDAQVLEIVDCVNTVAIICSHMKSGKGQLYDTIPL